MAPPASAPQLSAWLWRRQRALLRLLKGEERARVGAMPRPLRAYRRRFLEEFRSASPLPRSLRQVEEAVAQADLVFSADYHAHPHPETTHLRWLRLMARSGRRVVVALEMVSSRHQRALNELASGRLREDAFRRKIQFDTDWGFPWQPYGKLLRGARKAGCQLLALDHPERSGGVSVRSRDRHAAERLARRLARHPRNAILVVAGEMHLAEPHLPACTRRALEARSMSRRLVTLFHGNEGLFFSAGPRLDSERGAALELAPGRFCILQAAPWVRLLAHLRYLEGQECDQTAGPEEMVVQWSARTLALLAGVAPPARHGPEEEVIATGRAPARRIARRALARLEEGRARTILKNPERRSLWLTLVHCLIDPPMARVGIAASGRAGADGLRLYRRLMGGKVNLETLRTTLWSGATQKRSCDEAPHLPAERS